MLRRVTPASKVITRRVPSRIQNKFGSRLQLRGSEPKRIEPKKVISTPKMEPQQAPVQLTSQTAEFYLLFIDNLPLGITKDTIESIFSRYGTVKNVEQDESKAYITFDRNEDAINAHYTINHERKLRINKVDVIASLIKH